MSSVDQLGRFQRRRRLAIAILVVAILGSLLFVGTSDRMPSWLHEHVEQAGIVMIVAAILGRMWCTLYIGGRKGHEIVSGGPYSVTRNPLYVFSALGAAGIGAMSGSIIVSLAFALVTAGVFHYVILVEEAYLKQAFGEPYLAYMERVPRFLPNPFLFRESEMLSVRPQILYRTFTDGLVFMLAYPFFESVEYLQAAGILPVLLRLV